MYILPILVFIVVTTAAPPKFRTPNHFRNLYIEPPIGGFHRDQAVSRIIGGSEATPHSIPHQAFLEVYTNYQAWYCGGSLISLNYVMTAGHCGVDAIKAVVVLGAHRPLQDESSQQRLISTDVLVHEDYDAFSFNNDIALIKLSKSAEINAFVDVIGLPDNTAFSYAGETGRVSGWGLTDGFDNSLATVLNYVDNPILTNEECNEVFDIITASHVCLSGGNSKGTCNGDSGGPMSVGFVQVGIVSFGVRYCPSGYPSAFTRVSTFVEWIRNHSDVVLNFEDSKNIF